MKEGGGWGGGGGVTSARLSAISVISHDSALLMGFLIFVCEVR